MKNKLIALSIYFYVALPFIIFSAGFLKLPYAILTLVFMAVSLFLSVKDCETDFILPFKKKDAWKVLGVGVFLFIMVLLSGIGNVMWQNNDHATRNTIFDILVNYSWPPKAIVSDSETGLIYYIGFWLPSAVIGKAAGLAWGYAFQIIWAVAGLFILWYMLCVIHKKIVVYPIVIFLLFSGLDVLGHPIITAFYDNLSRLQIGTWAFEEGSVLSTHLEWWAGNFQYSSHTTQLFWVFNQCLPVWITTLLLLIEKNNKNMVFLMGLTLLASPLPFIGLIPIFIWCAVTNHHDSILIRTLTPTPLSSFLSMFTLQNVAGGGISGILTFLYLKGNISSASKGSQSASTASSAGFSFVVFFLILFICIAVFIFLRNRFKLPYLALLSILPLSFLMARLPEYKLSCYMLFVVFEVLIIAAAVFPLYKRSTLFVTVVSSLMIIPFFTVGRSIDFCMRASIPPLVVLCVFAIVALGEYVKDRKTLLAVFLSVVLALGAMNSFHEITRTLEATAYEITTKGRVVNDSKKVETVFKGKNFTGKTKDNFFFEVLAK